MYYKDKAHVYQGISIYLYPLHENNFIDSAINEMVNRVKRFFTDFFKQSTGVSNGIFKHCKLELNKDSKAFKQTRNSQKNSNNELYKRISCILFDKSKAVFRWLHRNSHPKQKRISLNKT